MLGCWLQTGNLNEISDAYGNRKVVFENTSPKHIIHVLTIVRFSNGTFEITAQAQDETTFGQLKLATKEDELNAVKQLADFRLSLLTSRLGLIGTFLKVLGIIEPEYEFIKKEVRTSLNVVFNLSQKPLHNIVLKHPPVNIVTSYNNFAVQKQLGLDTDANEKSSTSDFASPTYESQTKKRK